jgi:membrane protein HdeD
MKLWVKWLIIGILSIAFGIFVLANPVAASVAVTLVVGITFGVLGAAQIYAGTLADDTSSKIMGIGLGVLMLVLGISFMFKPLEGILSLATLATVLIAANGLLRLLTSWRMRDTPLFWPMLIAGALSVLLAGYILANFSQIAPQLLGILLGIELLFNGAGLIALALFLRTVKGALKDTLEKRLKEK